MIYHVFLNCLSYTVQRRVIALIVFSSFEHKFITPCIMLSYCPTCSSTHLIVSYYLYNYSRRVSLLNTVMRRSYTFYKRTLASSCSFFAKLCHWNQYIYNGNGPKSNETTQSKMQLCVLIFFVFQRELNPMKMQLR